MEIKIALAGNPNCGKTTIFNALTGSNQYVGNWPGVTVEKKEGRLKDSDGITVTDLPGIYSLSPYSPEEVVARDYLVNDSPDVILNVVDASNLQRNLYLTLQLAEIGLPMVLALNMMDIVKKRGDTINIERLSAELGCLVTEMTAMKEDGTQSAAEAASKLAGKSGIRRLSVYDGSVEKALSQISDLISPYISDKKKLRWFAVKLFERDEKIAEQLGVDRKILAEIDAAVKKCESVLGDDAISIIISQRYAFIDRVCEKCLVRASEAHSISEKIDRIVTSRFLAIPIFIVVMFLVYFLAISAVGKIFTDWANNGVFGEGWSFFGLWVPSVPQLAEQGLNAINCASWLKSLIIDGIIGGVGSVLGFLPQMTLLFLMLSLLEDCGYMSRVAFIMDRLFRSFGLSGKSFIPMLVSTGCGVPGVMASRTIENERDRRMTIMTTTFMPCGAKLPIIAMVSTVFFGGEWWVAPCAYFAGIAAIALSGIILRKMKSFSGKEAPFIMELPNYHLPLAKNVIHTVGDRCWSFVKRAGSVILLASIAIWFLSSFGFVGGVFTMVDEMSESVLRTVGELIAVVFKPLGFGSWQAATATVMGLLAKEEVIGVFGVLGSDGSAADAMNTVFGGSAAAAFSFMIFNLLCAPCIAAVSAIRTEMNSLRWTAFALFYQTAFAYISALLVYQLAVVGENGWTAGTFTAAALVLFALFLIFRKPYKKPNKLDN